MLPAVLHRAVYVDNLADPITSQSPTGRFHSGGEKATYLASTRATAWSEVQSQWLKLADSSQYRMVDIECRVPVVDLTDRLVQEEYGVTEDVLTSRDRSDCQRLATRLRSEGKLGVWTYSAADRPDGRQLVVFIDLIDRPELMPRILGIGPIDVA